MGSVEKWGRIEGWFGTGAGKTINIRKWKVDSWRSVVIQIVILLHSGAPEMLRIVLLMLLTFVACNQKAMACFAAPEHMYLSHDATIAHAEWIVIAQPIRRTQSDDGPAYEMRAIEYLKGDGPETFVIPNANQRAARHHSQQPAEGNYYAHTVSSFWEFGGSYSNWSDCEIHPGFLFRGHTYLIFGPLDYNLGFENITDEGDEWLSYVRAKLSEKTAIKPFPVAAAEFFGKAEAVVRVEVRWEGARASWRTDLLKGEERDYLRIAHVSPSAYFDSLVDPACRSSADVQRDKRMRSFFYVFEQLPTEEINKSDWLQCLGADRDSDGFVESRGKYSINGHRIYEIVEGEVTFSPDCPFYRNLNCKTPALRSTLSENEVIAAIE